jgi:hypothetical protein
MRFLPQRSRSAASADARCKVQYMDDRRDSAEWSVKHWAGTVGQLVEAARLSAERVAALVPYPVGYDPDKEPFDEGKYSQWHAAQAARELSIVIEEHEGFTGHPRDLNDLAAISEKTVRQVESIAITVGQNSYQAPSVTLRCGKGPLNSLSVKIEGFDRTWTAGLKHELNARPEPVASYPCAPPWRQIQRDDGWLCPILACRHRTGPTLPRSWGGDADITNRLRSTRCGSCDGGNDIARGCIGSVRVADAGRKAQVSPLAGAGVGRSWRCLCGPERLGDLGADRKLIGLVIRSPDVDIWVTCSHFCSHPRHRPGPQPSTRGHELAHFQANRPMPEEVCGCRTYVSGDGSLVSRDIGHTLG